MSSCSSRNKNILLAVTGGIAAYKAPELVRELKKRGHAIKVVLSKSAEPLVGALALQTVSENPVFTSVSSIEQEQVMNHIELAEWADVFLIAPATANCISSISLGLANDLITTLALVFKGPMMMAPAMNTNMWNSLVIKEHCKRLKDRDIKFIGPEVGELACGVFGVGKMSEPEDITKAVESLQLLKDKAQAMGQQILITAGPTQESIDPIRFISNHSSGKMGYALAEAFYRLGAEVTLISGPTALTTHSSIKRINVTSADEMLRTVFANLTSATMFIGTAAVSDYKLKKNFDEKLAKDEQLTLTLIKNPDIIAQVSASQSRPDLVVGFAAQTHNGLELARKKLIKKQLDLIILNEINAKNPGFGVDFNQVSVLSKQNEEHLPSLKKGELATLLAKKILTFQKNKDRENEAINSA